MIIYTCQRKAADYVNIRGEQDCSVNVTADIVITIIYRIFTCFLMFNIRLKIDLLPSKSLSSNYILFSHMDLLFTLMTWRRAVTRAVLHCTRKQKQN